VHIRCIYVAKLLATYLARKRTEIHSAANEVTMTECLRDGMRDALVRNRLPWRKTMIVAPGTESRSRPGMTAPDGRTDIPLFLTGVFAHSGEHDPHAIIECKRVAEDNAHLVREYIVEGVDRFRTGKYAENHGRGFMLGYVLSGTPKGVVRAINNYLIGRSRSVEVLDAASLTGVCENWVSRHSRTSGANAITLHHAMLPVAKPLQLPA
jgi:hypothetical protein